MAFGKRKGEGDRKNISWDEVQLQWTAKNKNSLNKMKIYFSLKLKSQEYIFKGCHFTKSSKFKILLACFSATFSYMAIPNHKNIYGMKSLLKVNIYPFNNEVFHFLRDKKKA